MAPSNNLAAKAGMGSSNSGNNAIAQARQTAQQNLTTSFRDRLQGLKKAQSSQVQGGQESQTAFGASGGGMQATTPTPQDTQGAASNQDLQKRLADMKAKLQGLNKK